MSQSILRNARPVAIVLGGAIAHIKLVNSLKERGYHVIIVDYYDHPPAKPFCDEHIQESALDEAKVLDIAKTRKASLVISLCLDQPLVIASAVSEALGLPSLLSLHTARLVTDKALMKQVMLENGIPTSRYMIADDDLRKMQIDLVFPLVVKPADSTGSQGVKKVMDMEEAERFRKEAMKFSRCGKVIVEEWCDGEELNVYCFVVNGKPNILLIARKLMDQRGQVGSNLLLGTISSRDALPAILPELEKVVASITSAFGILNAPMLVQLFHQNGKLSVIEVAARIGGGMGQYLVELVTGCDLIEASLQRCFDQEVILGSGPGNDLVYGTILLYARSGVFAAITGMEQAIETGSIHQHYTYMVPGTIVPEGLSTKNRVGAIIIKARSEAELELIRAEVLACVDVIDQSGSSIFYRNLYTGDH